MALPLYGRSEKWAAVLWTTAALVVCVRTALAPARRTVYPIFANAGRNWMAGAGLYGEIRPDLDVYLYSPLVAALHAPLALLADGPGGVLWRLLNLGVFLAALLWWARSVLPITLQPRQQGLLLLLVLPLAISSLNNGQSNLLLAGLILTGFACAGRQRWNLAAVCLALACALKVYPVAAGLLLAVLYPRPFAWRLLLALLVAALLPFLLQSPDYVAGQYADWARELLGRNHEGGSREYWLRDIRLLFRTWLLPLPDAGYAGLQLLGGLGTAALSLTARRAGCPTPRLLTLTTALACCWMTVLGPATESCTWILLGPSLAAAILLAWQEGESNVVKATLLGSYTLFAVSFAAHWFPFGHTVAQLGLQPIAGLLFAGCVVYTAVRQGFSVSRVGSVCGRAGETVLYWEGASALPSEEPVP